MFLLQATVLDRASSNEQSATQCKAIAKITLRNRDEEFAYKQCAKNIGNLLESKGGQTNQSTHIINFKRIESITGQPNAK